MESSSSEELSQSLSDSQYDAQTVSEDWTLLSDNEDMEPVVDSPETAQSSPPMVTVSAPDTTAATASHEVCVCDY
ncbi:unnamed protein product [Medioppia subpectinata]|uniref:Uncharacterized protein n=1 Tax=Medioppia subpectinata TaxID=1979941 RepID=A0A7R9LUB7_9ACAR|nr:unnamed protein product [Medioppia subpectinata]CAG2121821.1 unnamed protein product [Medioppia subpectinata]